MKSLPRFLWARSDLDGECQWGRARQWCSRLTEASEYYKYRREKRQGTGGPGFSWKSPQRSRVAINRGRWSDVTRGKNTQARGNLFRWLYVCVEVRKNEGWTRQWEDRTGEEYERFDWQIEPYEEKVGVRHYRTQVQLIWGLKDVRETNWSPFKKNAWLTVNRMHLYER